MLNLSSVNQKTSENRLFCINFVPATHPEGTVTNNRSNSASLRELPPPPPLPQKNIMGEPLTGGAMQTLLLQKSQTQLRHAQGMPPPPPPMNVRSYTVADMPPPPPVQRHEHSHLHHHVHEHTTSDGLRTSNSNGNNLLMRRV